MDKIYTKKPMYNFSSVRLKESDRELLRLAAARSGLSQSEFLRHSIRETAKKILLEGEQGQQT